MKRLEFYNMWSLPWNIADCIKAFIYMFERQKSRERVTEKSPIQRFILRMTTPPPWLRPGWNQQPETASGLPTWVQMPKHLGYLLLIPRCIRALLAQKWRSWDSNLCSYDMSVSHLWFTPLCLSKPHSWFYQALNTSTDSFKRFVN